MKKKFGKLLCWHRWDNYDLFGVRTCEKCGCQSRYKGVFKL